MADDIENARAAHAALVAAKNACATVGIRDGRGALAEMTETAKELVKSLERRSVPVAFGGDVEVTHYTGKRWTMRVKSVGSANITMDGGEKYRLSDGYGREGYAHIHEDDLFRIKRDLVGKRPPKATKGASNG